MNPNDFIKDKNNITWGRYPYYTGETYNKDNICYMTYGCTKALTYGAIDRTNGIKINSDYEGYLSMDVSSKNYYGDGIFQRKTLSSDDDYIRKLDGNFAIPTKAELESLLDNSNVYVTIQESEMGLVIAPSEGTRSIFIPFMGHLFYEQQGAALVGKISGFTEYNYGIKNDYSDGYRQIIEYTSEIRILTSDLPSSDNRVWALVIKIQPHSVKFDLDKDGVVDDLEFLGFDVIEQSGKTYSFQEIKYATKDIGLIVLPIYSDNNFNITFKGGLYLNGSTLGNFNQNTGNDNPPLFKFDGFGVPAVVEGVYNETFSMTKQTAYSLGTTFRKDENTTIVIDEFETKNFINEGENKVKIKNGKNYWILENNPNLYKVDLNENKSLIVLDTRGLFGSKQTSINIDVSVDFTEKYEPKGFVLPSIYKPFHIKRLYSIDYFDGNYDLTFNLSVYNGIGLFAKQGANNKPKMRSIGGNFGFNDMNNSSNDQFQVNQSNGNTSLVKPGWVNPNITTGGGSTGGGSTSSGSTGEGPSIPGGPSIPSTPQGPTLTGSTEMDKVVQQYYTTEDYGLRTTLNSYFDGDARFYENIYDLYDKNEDLYAVGLINDSVVVGSQGLSPAISVYRTKPLILCNYNESIFEVIGWGEVVNLKKQETVFVDTNFISVKEPYKNTQFNRSQKINYGGINFGDLYDKVKIYYVPITSAGAEPRVWPKYDSKTDVVNIISSGNTNGIRYYLVNKAFYDNYISSPESKNGVSYNEDYLKNKEFYDLNPHLVDFTVGDTYNNRFADEFFDEELDYTEYEGIKGEWTGHTYDEEYYVPFFDMTPSLRNTLGYAYSKVEQSYINSDNFKINYNAPIAMELYINNNEINFNYKVADNSQAMYYYRHLYLIGVYSPLTVLPGSCMEKEGMYYNQIMNNTTLLPQCDETTIIYCYGEVTINEEDPDLKI